VATTTSKLMTFAEFERLPDTPEGYRCELRHGEMIKMAPPKYDHFMIQQILRDLLDKAAAGAGRVFTEAGFRPLPDGEFRIADLAYASNEQWARSRSTQYFLGAPQIVIEVLSPSNTAAEMNDKEKLCLENGCQEFWIVDPDLHLVKVSTPDGRTITYRSGQDIPLPLLNGGRLAVDSIFTPAEG
jgi:Uma2 family endonuclease